MIDWLIDIKNWCVTRAWNRTERNHEETVAHKRRETLRWPSWWTFVFSGNLPQCCVLIELLYCGLIKFFFFLKWPTLQQYHLLHTLMWSETVGLRTGLRPKKSVLVLVLVLHAVALVLILILQILCCVVKHDLSRSSS